MNCLRCKNKILLKKYEIDSGMKNTKRKFCGVKCSSKSMKLVRNLKTPIQRFEDKFKKDDKNKCWNWTAYKTKLGYGSFSLDGTSKITWAHRASYILYVGEIPDGMFVCHKCDNPSCVNPNHLYIGTPKQNSRDRDLRGRAAYQKPGYVSPQKGKTKYDKVINGKGCLLVKCSFCSKKFYKSGAKVGKYCGDFCDMKCRTKFLWSEGILGRSA